MASLPPTPAHGGANEPDSQAPSSAPVRSPSPTSSSPHLLASDASPAPAPAAAPGAEPVPADIKTCVWTVKDDDKLLDVLEEAQRQKKQSGGGFKPEVWEQAANELRPMREKGAVKRAKEVKSHWRNLKKTWKEAKELLNLSGFGWNEEGGKVTAQDDVWDELIKRTPKFKKWKNKTFPNYPRIDALSAKSTATGEFARDGGAEAGSGDEDEEEDGEDGSEKDSDDDDADLVPPSRKRKRPSAVGAMADIASAL
ncbi:unnamed protein product, partial [Tilletia controversa]